MALGIIRGGLLAASALLAFSTPGQAGAHRAARMDGDRALSVLYDQTNNASDFGTPSQSFFGQTVMAADDFTVPDGTTWNIKEIDVPGIYFNGSGPPKNVNIVFSKDRDHKPGRILADMSLAPSADDLGTFKLTLGSHHVKLKGGHYWLTIVADVDSAEWFWKNQTAGTIEGDPAVWQNPSGSTCTTWTVESECGVGTGGDQMFVLKGRAK